MSAIDNFAARFWIGLLLAVGFLVLSALAAARQPWTCVKDETVKILSVDSKLSRSADSRQTLRNGGSVAYRSSWSSEVEYEFAGLRGHARLSGLRDDLSPGAEASLPIPADCSSGRFPFDEPGYGVVAIFALLGTLLLFGVWLDRPGRRA